MVLAKLLPVLSPSQRTEGHWEWLSGLRPCLLLASQKLGEDGTNGPEKLCRIACPAQEADPTGQCLIKTKELKVGMVAPDQGPVGRVTVLRLFMEWSRAGQGRKMSWHHPHHWKWQWGSCSCIFAIFFAFPKACVHRGREQLHSFSLGP